MKEVYYTWQEFDDDVKEIVSKIEDRSFDGIWAPPRGGLPLAVMFSHALGYPMLLKPTEETLICDDIADTGRTLDQYKDKHFIVTLFYHRNSIVTPDIWMREKTDGHIVFPWEICPVEQI